MEEKHKQPKNKMNGLKKTIAAVTLLGASLTPTQALGCNILNEYDIVDNMMQGDIIQMCQIEINSHAQKLMNELKIRHGINVTNIQIANGDTWQISLSIGGKKWFVSGQDTLETELNKILKNAERYKNSTPEPER